jgi:hypothetical protein
MRAPKLVGRYQSVGHVVAECPYWKRRYFHCLDVASEFGFIAGVGRSSFWHVRDCSLLQPCQMLPLTFYVYEGPFPRRYCGTYRLQPDEDSPVCRRRENPWRADPKTAKRAVSLHRYAGTTRLVQGEAEVNAEGAAQPLSPGHAKRFRSCQARNWRNGVGNTIRQS